MDYKELIGELRALSKHVPEQMCDDGGKDPLEKAVTAIETLLAERDAAVNLLHGACYACKNKGTHYSEAPCSLCKWGGMVYITPIAKLQDSWQWRGPKKESGNDG